LFSLIPLCPLLRTISTDFIVLFLYMNTKYIHYICHFLPFPYAFLPPTGTHSWAGLFYLPVLHFSKCIFIFKQDFTLVFQECIYCTSIRLTPVLLTPFLLPGSPIKQLTVHSVILSSYTDALFQYFSISNMLTLFLMIRLKCVNVGALGRMAM
jgi:hypothetical protein